MTSTNFPFAERTKQMQRSTIREILKVTALPDIISFAGGLPAPELFPIERIKEAFSIVMAERGEEALQYSTTEGMPELRQLIADRMSNDKLKIELKNIITVTGSQQGLDLICRVFLNEGDGMVIENPSYLGMLMASRLYSPTYLPAGTDEGGIFVNEVEAYIKNNPKIVYLVPNFQNPQGITLNLERRKQLTDLTHDAPLILIEDNPYGELRYDGEASPSLLQLDAEKRGTTGIEGNVIYLGTFSKILSPGLRTGWIVAHENIIDKLVQAKQSSDLHTSTLDQFIGYQVAKDGFIDQHIDNLKVVYKNRRDLMLDAMSEHFPEGITWQKPEGGLFLMVYLPEYIDSSDLLQKAVELKVAFVPGTGFHVHDVGANTFRLNYSNAKEDQIVEGIKRLGILLKDEIAKNS